MCPSSFTWTDLTPKEVLNFKRVVTTVVSYGHKLWLFQYFKLFFGVLVYFSR